MQNKQLWIIAIFIALAVGALSFFAFSTQSVISVSQPIKFENGKYYFLANIYPSSTEGLTFTIRPQEQSVGGQLVKPRQDLNIQFENAKTFCKYDVEQRTINSPFMTQTFYVFKPAKPIVSASYKMKFDGKYDTEFETIDNNWQTKDLLDGKIKLETLGVVGAVQNCRDYGFTNQYVLSNKSGTWQFYDVRNIGFSYSTFLNTFNLNSLFLTFVNAYTVFDNPSYGEISDINNIEYKNNQMLVYPKGKELLGVPNILITADADMFDSVIVNPQKALKPEIVGTPTCANIGSNDAKCVITARNLGDSTGKFYITPKPTNALVQPSSYSQDMTPNIKYNFEFITSRANQNIAKYQVCFEICSGSFDKECASACSNQADVLESSTPTPVPVPSVNPSKADCELIPNNFYDTNNGQCLCSGDYEKSFDKQTGKMICEKPFSAYLIYIFGGAIIALIIIYFAFKGGKRR
jgi:hypothetical protein